jgi:hypothetical protein
MSPVISASGAFSNAGATGQTTLTVATPVLGNLRALMCMVNNTTTVSSVSGGGVDTTNGGLGWLRGTGVTASGNTVEVWYGTVTNTVTNPTTITVAWSGSIAGVVAEYASQMLQSDRAAHTQWLVDAVGTNSSATGTALTWPSLTPTRGVEAYFGGVFVASSGVAGSTSGYTYQLTPFSNIALYNPAVSAASAPTATQTSSGFWVSAGITVSAHDRGQFFQAS